MTYAVVGDWGRHAACIHNTTTMLMPTGRGRYASRHELDRIAAARQVCAGCPVYDDCRDWALTTPDPCDAMIAAGMTPGERQFARDMGRLRA